MYSKMIDSNSTIARRLTKSAFLFITATLLGCHTVDLNEDKMVDREVIVPDASMGDADVASEEETDSLIIDNPSDVDVHTDEGTETTRDSEPSSEMVDGTEQGSVPAASDTGEATDSVTETDPVALGTDSILSSDPSTDEETDESTHVDTSVSTDVETDTDTGSDTTVDTGSDTTVNTGSDTDTDPEIDHLGLTCTPLEL